MARAIRVWPGSAYGPEQFESMREESQLVIGWLNFVVELTVPYASQEIKARHKLRTLSSVPQVVTPFGDLLHKPISPTMWTLEYLSYLRSAYKTWQGCREPPSSLQSSAL